MKTGKSRRYHLHSKLTVPRNQTGPGSKENARTSNPDRHVANSFAEDGRVWMICTHSTSGVKIGTLAETVDR
jgi:hypothetical protein